MAGSNHEGMDRRLAARGARLLRKFRRDTSGVAALVVLMVPVIVGMMGLTIDVGFWYSAKRGLQDTADAAAMAAGTDLANGGSNSRVTATAQGDANRNGFNPTTDVITVNVPPLTGPSAGNTGSVEIIVTRTLPLFFTTLFLDTPFTARVRSVVNTIFIDEFCILGLDPTEAKAVNVFGTGTATFDCGIAVNSDADNALSVTGGAEINVTTVGGLNIGNNATLGVDAPPRRGAPVTDPYADLTVPPIPPCTNTADSPTKGTKVSGSDEIFDAGAFGGIFVFCGGLDVTAGATVTLEPGVYIIDQGDFNINGGGAIEGDGVTIILASSGADSKIGKVSVTGNGEVDLSAPTSDPAGAPGFAGVLFFQDRGVSSNPSKSNLFAGGSELDLAGALYFPNQDLDFTGGSELGDGCTQLIGKKVSIGGDAGVQGNCDTTGTRSIGRLKAKLGE